MIILEAKNLSKHFEGVYAVQNLSVAFEKGKITGLIGPNGSGKSTLTHLLSGMISADSGAILVSDAKLSDLKSWQVLNYGLTRTFQEVRLFNQMTVLDNLLVVLTSRSILGAFMEKHGQYHLEIAENILKQINLWEKRAQLAINLSYGQRKLLEIGRALATQAEIYLLDEPFAGLFPEMARTVKQLLFELKKSGKTIVLIEHNMELIREISDEVLVMDAGKLLAQGRPNEVLKKREVIEAYLGE